MGEKKSRILAVKRFLEEHTDEAHPVSIAGIITHLKTKGIAASRKTITLDIAELVESGIDVVCKPGSPHKYYIGARHFKLPELKLLVDAVRASRFIPTKKADALINKLAATVSHHQAGELHRSLYTDTSARPAGGSLFATVDLLHTAVNTEKKIKCKYIEWNAEKKRVYKHRRQEYDFSPYGLVWNDDRYYVVGWSDNHEKVITLRVDRIAAPKLTDTDAALKPEGFDMAYYAESVIHMYDGPVREVTLLCENEMMRHVIDRFGVKVNTEVIDTEHFIARVLVAASPTFFAWVFTFRGGIRIAEPTDVASAYKEMAQTANC